MLDSIVRKDLVKRLEGFEAECSEAERTGFGLIAAIGEGDAVVAAFKAGYEAEMARRKGNIIEDPL